MSEFENKEIEKQDQDFDSEFELAFEDDVQSSNADADDVVSDNDDLETATEKIEYPENETNNRQSQVIDNDPLNIRNVFSERLQEQVQLQSPIATQTNKNVEITEELQADLEELERLDPRAAALAREDSPEGEIVRKRLIEYGSTSAQDKADIIFARREYDLRAKQIEQQNVLAHNRNFATVMRQYNPEYMDMLENPNRRAESNKYIADIKSWIENKPYKEAVHMMNIANNSRDPHEVGRLIQQYKKEKGLSATTHNLNNTNPKVATRDITGAYAVPTRGTAVNSVDGYADDFDAGFYSE